MAQQREVLPLEGLEEIEIDGQLYEAFNTSGGLGSLAESFGAGVESMDYKTIRYPGHCEQMRLLMNGLKLNQDRGTLKRILENAVPQTLQDVVIIYVAVTGMQDGELREENYVNKVYPQVIAGRLWSAIQVTTAAGLCAVLDLVLPLAGAVPGLRAPGAVPAAAGARQPLRPLLQRATQQGRVAAPGGGRQGRAPARQGQALTHAKSSRAARARAKRTRAFPPPAAGTARPAHRGSPRSNPATGKALGEVHGATNRDYEELMGATWEAFLAVARGARAAPGRGHPARRRCAARSTRMHSARWSAWRPARSRPRATAKSRR